MSLSAKSKFIWRTSDGRKIKLKDIKDDHLKNIIRKFFASGEEPIPYLREEYKERGLQPEYVEFRKSIIRRPTYQELTQKLEELENRIKILEKFNEV